MAETRYGFDWGNATVQRLTEIRGTRYLNVATAKDKIELAITPSGLIRVYVHVSAARKAAASTKPRTKK